MSRPRCTTSALAPDGHLVVVANMGMLQLRDARTGKADGRVILGAMATGSERRRAITG